MSDNAETSVMFEEASSIGVYVTRAGKIILQLPPAMGSVEIELRNPAELELALHRASSFVRDWIKGGVTLEKPLAASVKYFNSRIRSGDPDFPNLGPETPRLAMQAVLRHLGLGGLRGSNPLHIERDWIEAAMLAYEQGTSNTDRMRRALNAVVAEIRQN